jgi:argininosuccinate lyase
MGEAKVGEEFITHEFDEAIAVQRTIVAAEEQLSRSHPFPAAKTALKATLKDDRQYLTQLEKLGKEHGATGKAEEVAEGLQQLMQETAQKASEAESEAYEAHAVLLNLKRKQQDSAAAMLKIARSRKDTKMRDAALEFERGTRESAKALSSQLAAFAVKIAGAGSAKGRQPSR